MLEIRELGLKYAEFELKDISFHLKNGERLSIIGLSGSGKSSLLKSIYGLFDLHNGEILFDNLRVKGPAEVLIPGHPRMKLVDQNFALDNYHSVGENISNRILHLDKEDIYQKKEELLHVVNLKPYEDQLAHTLSGGQKQRLALARSLAQIPELLLLDEPFSQIDLMNKFEIEKSLFDYLDRYAISTIMVTHDYQDAFTLSDRILIMENGRISNDLDKVDLYENPNSHYEAMITGGYNEIQFNHKNYNFRKNEFRLVEENGFSIEVEIEQNEVLYLGAKFVCKAITKRGETIILESSSPIKSVKKIYIPEKDYQFAN
ncbi:MAG: ABC transporter ATP-binding protein [Crocinitomicaceae bacterium]